MTNEDVLQLVRQGFTADEIRALGWSSQDHTPEAPEALETPETPEAVEAPKVAPEIEETIKGLSETVATLTETVKAMQVSNQKNAKKSKNDNAPKSADEVIKGFIENM